MIINCTNHPSSLWSESQRSCASVYGEILDYSFPSVDPNASEEKLKQLEETTVGDLLAQHPAAVLVQGESVLCFRLVTALKAEGILVLAACSERIAAEDTDQDGNVIKKSLFRFVRFREY